MQKENLPYLAARLHLQPVPFPFSTEVECFFLPFSPISFVYGPRTEVWIRNTGTLIGRDTAMAHRGIGRYRPGRCEASQPPRP